MRVQLEDLVSEATEEAGLVATSQVLELQVDIALDSAVAAVSLLETLSRGGPACFVWGSLAALQMRFSGCFVKC